MATDAKKPNDKPEKDGAAASKGGKRKLFLLGGGGVGLIAAAYAVAIVAVPKKVQKPELQGPFVAPLTGEKVQVNLSKSKSFLVLNLNLVYMAYDEAYFTARTSDPLCMAELKDALVSIASSKTPAEFEDKVNKPVIMEEIRQAAEPILFPVHVGESTKPTDKDPDSGLAPGISAHLATFRGLYRGHTLTVDALKGIVRLDGGPPVTFQPGDRDLKLTANDGSDFYLDLSGLDPKFQGEVNVGVRGQARRILWQEVLIQ
jgi:flagellar basal body-associated protein FliL